MSQGVLIMGGTVGSGTYGHVVNSFFYNKKLVITDYEGEPLESNAQYAIKVQRKSEVENEIAVLKRLGTSRFIVKCYGKANLPQGYSTLEDAQAMVMELLNETLKARSSVHIDLNKRRTFFPTLLLEMFRAVEFLHSNNIAHLDLHAGNIMFGKNKYRPKLIDFGLAKLTNKPFVPFKMKEDSAIRKWHPPEQFGTKEQGRVIYGKCTKKFDVYSMAMNMIELVYDPSKNKNINEKRFDFLILRTLLHLNAGVHLKFKFVSKPTQLHEDIRVRSGDIYTCFERGSDGFPKLYLHMPVHIGNVLKRCLMFEAERPTASEVVNLIEPRASQTRSIARPSPLARLRSMRDQPTRIQPTVGVYGQAEDGVRM